MQTWERRPTEFAHLFNPAFCSVILQGAVRDFGTVQEEGMPYALFFLVLPIVLHKSTRQVLPKKATTKLHAWLQEHPQVLIGFADRTRSMVPYTKEALAFGLHTDIIRFNDNGNLTWVRKKIKTLPWETGTERAECYSKAKLTGRWLGQSGETATIYTMWGIRP
ncbi:MULTISPECIES: three component ABC system middle component [Leptolyngbya]|uniref:three component ABC system middle component n=1 Tax=Leptolyngbya TaxID=47251 RepID=UPI00168697A0|nr:hypothetical protein [Leptolyngbya sp. FACHB-1624]